MKSRKSPPRRQPTARRKKQESLNPRSLSTEGIRQRALAKTELLEAILAGEGRNRDCRHWVLAE